MIAANSLGPSEKGHEQGSQRLSQDSKFVAFYLTCDRGRRGDPKDPVLIDGPLLDPAFRSNQRPMQELADTDRSRLLERFGRSFEAGASIYREGHKADACYLIEEGRVRLVKKIRSSERSLTVLRPGDLFGEDALIPDAERSASAIALTDLVVLALDRKTFGILLSGNAEVAGRLVGQLVRRLRDAEEQLENAMLRDHPSRVVNTLLRLAATGQTTADGHALQISPLELSSRVGLDVDAVKRAVQQLRDGGYLRIVDERILLPDLDALRRLYELLGMKEEVRGEAR